MRSMTGCGRGNAEDGDWEASVEVRSVNHRFLDVACRLPRNLSFLEDMVRRAIAGKVRRGHVDVFVNVRRMEGAQQEVRVNLPLAESYLMAAKVLGEKLGKKNGKMMVAQLMRMDGVLEVTEAAMDEEAVAAAVQGALNGALSQLDEMRLREGAALASDLKQHLDAAEAIGQLIAERAPGVVEDYRKRLQERLQKVNTEPADPIRLAQEVALWADKCAIDEELSRLSSHISQMRTCLAAEGEIGKRMDFLIQEMNREANTMGSKANDAEIAQLVVELKSEIEKLREQVQNAE